MATRQGRRSEGSSDRRPVLLLLRRLAACCAEAGLSSELANSRGRSLLRVTNGVSSSGGTSTWVMSTTVISSSLSLSAA